MFHCHNLIHEDHEMLGAFNVTALADFGYTEKTHFIDPMEERYRAKPFQDGDFAGADTGAAFQVHANAQPSRRCRFFWLGRCHGGSETWFDGKFNRSIGFPLVRLGCRHIQLDIS